MIKKDKSCGLVPFRWTDKTIVFLLIQHHGGHWGFPKGHPEKGESDYQASCREFEEETGIKDYRVLDFDPLVETYKFNKRDETIHKSVYYYLAETSVSEVICQASEIKDYGWFDYQTAKERISFDGSRQILEQAWRLINEQ